MALVSPMKTNAETWAKLGITILFLALVRTLAEVLHRWNRPSAPSSLSESERLVAGALMAAIFCWGAVTLFSFGRKRAVVITCLLALACLLAYKVLAIGW